MSHIEGAIEWGDQVMDSPSSCVTLGWCKCHKSGVSPIGCCVTNYGALSPGSGKNHTRSAGKSGLLVWRGVDYSESMFWGNSLGLFWSQKGPDVFRNPVLRLGVGTEAVGQEPTLAVRRIGDAL